jgi:hypothetical protein
MRESGMGCKAEVMKIVGVGIYLTWKDTQRRVELHLNGFEESNSSDEDTNNR